MTSKGVSEGNLENEFRGVLRRRKKLKGEPCERGPVVLTRNLFTTIIQRTTRNIIGDLEEEIRSKMTVDSVRVREMEDEVYQKTARILELGKENSSLKEEIGLMMKEVADHKEKLSNSSSERCPESQLRIVAENENLKREIENMKQKFENETIEKDGKINQLQTNLKDMEMNSQDGLINRKKHRARIKVLKQENAKLSRSLDEKETVLRNTIQELETSKYSIENISQELTSEKEMRRNLSLGAKAKNEESFKIQDELKSHLDAANGEKKNLEDIVKQMEQDLTQEKKIVEKEIQQKRKADKQLELLQNTLQMKCSDFESVQKASDEIREKHDVLNKKVIRLQEALSAKEKYAIGLKETNKKLQDDLQSSEAMFHETLEMQAKELQDVKKQFKTSEDQIAPLRQCQGDLCMRQAQVQSLTEKILELDSQCKDLKEDIESKEKMLQTADEEAEAFKQREVDAAKLISSLEAKSQEMCERLEEQSKGFKKVSDENMDLAKRLRSVISDQKEESEQIESLMNINKELKEVNESLENEITDLKTNLNYKELESMNTHEENEEEEEEEGEVAVNLSLEWDGSPPDSKISANEEGSIDRYIDILKSLTEIGENEVVNVEAEIPEPASPSSPRHCLIEGKSQPDALIDKYSGKILLEQMEDCMEWMKKKTEIDSEKIQLLDVMKSKEGTYSEMKKIAEEIIDGNEIKKCSNVNQKENHIVSAEKEHSLKKKRSKLAIENINLPQEGEKNANSEPKKISKEDKIRNFLRPFRDFVPSLSNKEWAFIERKIIKKYFKSKVNIKESYLTELIKPVIINFAELRKNKKIK